MKETEKATQLFKEGFNCSQSVFCAFCHRFDIDEETGKIGYVSYLNPKEFQLLSAANITDIKSSYVKGPLGGTSYVYFEFFYNKQKVRIPTFTSNNTYSLESSEVLEGISKADTFAEILTNAQNQAS